ncbi:MAG: PD-(D/E)XK nuclease-like domain-containing protein [Paludibacteraceae bacterium]|nr:PD-(D/E)XK nuclease-like domain-containing protein [Paludibacteraceae bacterium]
MSRTSRLEYAYKGEKHTLREWSKITGITYGTLYSRILDHKWSLEDAFNKPVRKKKSKSDTKNIEMEKETPKIEVISSQIKGPKTKFNLSDDNYYSNEANLVYCSASQFKDFVGFPLRPGCEERALKAISGEYKQENTKALLQGSLLDALWENDDPDYIMERFPDCVSTRGVTKGQLKSEYQQVMDMYQRTLREEKFCAYMSGDKQTIMTGTIEGLDFKIKMDSFIDGKAIVDLKTTKSLDRNLRYYIPDSGERLPFYLAYGYDTQLAIYREIVRQNTGDKLRCYIAAVDKDAHPTCDIIELNNKLLDDALEHVKSHCNHIIMLKKGEIEPIRCERSECDYCRDTHKCQVISSEEFELSDE